MIHIRNTCHKGVVHKVVLPHHAVLRRKEKDRCALTHGIRHNRNGAPMLFGWVSTLQVGNDSVRLIDFTAVSEGVGALVCVMWPC